MFSDKVHPEILEKAQEILTKNGWKMEQKVEQQVSGAIEHIPEFLVSKNHAKHNMTPKAIVDMAKRLKTT